MKNPETEPKPKPIGGGNSGGSVKPKPLGIDPSPTFPDKK